MKHSNLPAAWVRNLMRLSRLTLSVLALIAAGCSNGAQDGTENAKDQSDRFKQEGLTGDVAAIDVRTYEAKTEFGETSRGELKGRYTKTFDEKGMVLSMVEFYDPSDETAGSTTYKYAYTDGKLDTMTVGQDGTYVVYDYFPNGELKTLTKYDGEGNRTMQFVYALNEEGKKAEERILDANGELQNRFVMTYEKNVCHTRSYNQKNEYSDFYYTTYPDSTVYEVYDHEGGKQKLIYKTVHNSRNELTVKTDRLMSLMTDKVAERTVYGYERDEKGNWTMCTAVDDENGMPMEILERTITYR